MAQIQGFINYQAILKSFEKEHARGTAVFQRLYSFSQHDAFFMLVRREWKRWYAYKTCVKLIEFELVGTEQWVVDNLSQPTMKNLQKKCRKRVQALHYPKYVT